MRIYIKPYESEWREKCAEVYTNIFNSEPFFYEWLNLPNVSRYFEDLENTPKFKGFLCFDENDEFVGACLGVVMDYFGVVQYEIKEIFVKLALQGLKYGSEMLELVEDELFDFGVNSIVLYCSADTKAVTFYERNDYERLDKTVHFNKWL